MVKQIMELKKDNIDQTIKNNVLQEENQDLRFKVIEICQKLEKEKININNNKEQIAQTMIGKALNIIDLQFQMLEENRLNKMKMKSVGCQTLKKIMKNKSP